LTYNHVALGYRLSQAGKPFLQILMGPRILHRGRGQRREYLK